MPLLKKHEIKTYYGIIGLVISSIFVMCITTLKYSFNLLDIIIGFILLISGIKISSKLEML